MNESVLWSTAEMLRAQIFFKVEQNLMNVEEEAMRSSRPCIVKDHKHERQE